MIRIPQMLRTVLPLMLVLAAMPAASDTSPPTPIIDSTSTGLVTFSREERLVRVAAVFAARDSAVIPTVVRFLDQGGRILKQVRGDLSESDAVIAELTRTDVAGRGDVLIRVEIHHLLPGLRPKGYPIMVSMQPIGSGGSGAWLAAWATGSCNNPFGGPPVHSDPYAECVDPPSVSGSGDILF